MQLKLKANCFKNWKTYAKRRYRKKNGIVNYMKKKRIEILSKCFGTLKQKKNKR